MAIATWWLNPDLGLPYPISRFLFTVQLFSVKLRFPHRSIERPCAADSSGRNTPWAPWAAPADRRGWRPCCGAPRAARPPGPRCRSGDSSLVAEDVSMLGKYIYMKKIAIWSTWINLLYSFIIAIIYGKCSGHGLYHIIAAIYIYSCPVSMWFTLIYIYIYNW